MIQKIAKWAGAITAIVVVGFVCFDTYSAAQESKSTAEIVEQLQEIHIKENTAEEAEKNQLIKFCLDGTIKDQSKCAEVGIKLDE